MPLARVDTVRRQRGGEEWTSACERRKTCNTCERESCGIAAHEAVRERGARQNERRQNERTRGGATERVCSQAFILMKTTWKGGL